MVTIHDIRRRMPAIFFTGGLLSLVTFALGGVVGYPGWVVAVAIVSVFVLSHVFPRSDFFNVVYANGIAIYACLFGFFSESLFLTLEAWQLSAGFALPLAGFLAGVVLRRQDIRSILDARRIEAEKTPLSRALIWILPVLAVGVMAFVWPIEGGDAGQLDLVFFASMSVIALVVLWASRDIAVLLMDTGLLFEDFLQTAAELIQPVLAFFTFYSLDVVVFSCVYRSIDHISKFPHFTVDGVARDLDFTESLYFSFITLSTVGYGDILPVTDGIRIVVASQVLTGIVLILFGVHAVIEHTGRKLPGKK